MNQDSDRGGRCAVAGSVGSVIGVCLSFAIGLQPEVSWLIVHGGWANLPWIADEHLKRALWRLAAAVVLGGILGGKAKSPRVAFWAGLGFGFFLSWMSFIVLPETQRIRE
jgi:hypothetical protein